MNLAIVTAGWCRLLGVTVLAAGCSAGGNLAAPDPPRDTVAPAASTPTAAELDMLLLSVAEVNTAMRSTGMAVAGTWTSTLDASSHIAEKECVFAYPAERSVYAVSRWTAARRQLLDEPGDHPSHEVTQAVVAFASADDAARFFTGSSQHWMACSDHRYRHVSLDDPDVAWTTGPVENTNGTLRVTATRDGGGWSCQRALTVSDNLAADIAACAAAPPPDAAMAIARQIAVKAAGR